MKGKKGGCQGSYLITRISWTCALPSKTLVCYLDHLIMTQPYATTQHYYARTVAPR